MRSISSTAFWQRLLQALTMISKENRRNRLTWHGWARMRMPEILYGTSPTEVDQSTVSPDSNPSAKIKGLSSAPMSTVAI